MNTLSTVPGPNYKRYALLLLILFLWGNQVLYAQTASIRSEVDRTVLGVDDTLRLTVTIDGQPYLNLKPRLPTLNSFTIVEEGQNPEVVHRDRGSFPQLVYHYILQPTRAGTLLIGAAKIDINGQTFFSKPIPIQVEANVANAAVDIETTSSSNDAVPDGDRYIEVDISSTTPYVGQQILYTFRYFQESFLPEQVDYNPPSFLNFWVAQTLPPKRYTTETVTQTFRVSEIQTILFPMQDGLLIIDPAEAIVNNTDTGSQTVLKASSIDLDVQLPPSDSPATFQGAVGQFTLKTMLDKREAQVNDPFTLRVTVQGRGNINTLPEPTWPNLSNWRSISGPGTTETSLDDGWFSGKRTYERNLITENSGTFTIPPIKYAYFDPARKQYRVLSSDPLTVQVRANNNADLNADTLPQTFAPNRRTASDIRHIKTVPLRLQPKKSAMTAQRIYWFAWGTPLLFIVMYAVWHRIQPHQRLQRTLANRDRAFENAMMAIREAEANPDDQSVAASQILNSYLTEKLGTTAEGLPPNTLRRYLQKDDIANDQIDQVVNLLDQLDATRYGPNTNKNPYAPNALYLVSALISNIERPTIIATPPVTEPIPQQEAPVDATISEDSQPPLTVQKVDETTDDVAASISEVTAAPPATDEPEALEEAAATNVTEDDGEPDNVSEEQAYQNVLASLAAEDYTTARNILVSDFLQTEKHAYKDVPQLFAYVVRKEALVGRSRFFQKYAPLLNPQAVTSLLFIFTVSFLLGMITQPLFAPDALRFVYMGGVVSLWVAALIMFVVHQRRS
ncbi:MAG: BatD family protein [Chloroflexota bacterium]